MQGRVSFNAGEFAPELGVRADIEYYNRGCLTLENWEVSQLGGVRRRKGMRKLADALSADSVLIPYVYSYEEEENMRFLVEVDGRVIRVLSLEGEEIKRFTSDENVFFPFAFTKQDIRYKQVNAMLFLTSLANPPLVLEYDGVDEWTLELFDIKYQPWRDNHEEKDYAINVKRIGTTITVEFPEDAPAHELPDNLLTNDWLRTSYWVEQQEAPSVTDYVLEGVGTPVSEVPATANEGDKFVLNTDDTVKYWVCTNDWSVADNYVAGMDSPANYPNQFIAVENASGFEDVVAKYSIKDVGDTISKGTKIAIKAGYWEYYTCVKAFDDKVEGFTKFTDYPGYFIQGVEVGNALPCKGEWAFYCSGVWVGCYVVRRNYDTAELNAEWEDRGLSFSRNDAVSNTQCTGTETDEACYVRLFLTKSKKMSDSDVRAGFPPDSCGNRLIVKGYKHDMVLHAVVVEDDDTDEKSIVWECEDKVQTTWTANREVTDWSWAAFSERNGYPFICDVFNSRLVFASTKAQPQSIWMSKVDDINNFMTGKADDNSVWLTMLTTTQNPICWLKPRGDKIMLGTSEAEFVISSGSNALTSSTATIRDHSYIGSQRLAVLGASDKMLYVERGAGRVWTFEYSLEIDGWRSSDLTVFAPHIAQEHGGFVRASMIKKPDTVALYVLGDGQLALCTYNSLQEVKAWHRWTTDGLIKEVCGMPNGNENDKIYFIVERDGVANIEVVDEQSDYTDNGVDYVSELKTTALNNFLEAYVAKKRNPVVKLCICQPFELTKENLTVSTDGETWWPSDMWDGEIKKGWHQVISPKSWDYEQFVAIRVQGNQAFNFIALQA